MAFEGWLSYAGTEILNVARVAQYSGIVGGGCNCAELAEALEDKPYVRPDADRAPWFDVSVPESSQFYGIMGLELIGADTGTVTYQWTEFLGDGGVPGAMRRASKEIQVKALAVAGSAAGMSYGMGWLASALRGSSCRDACFGDDLCLLAACPVRPRRDPTWNPVNGSPGAPGFHQLIRTGYNTTLLEGPEVTNRYWLGGQVLHEVQFTLKLGVPFWYREMKLVVRGDGNTGPSDPTIYQDTIPNYDPWNWQAGCAQAISCLDDDPYCLTPPAPPIDAPMPPDPCNPNDPRNYGAGRPPPYNNPNGYRFNAGRSIFSIPRGTGSDWGEKVPIFKLYTGSLPFRRLMLRWYDNPTGRRCDNTLDPCFSCAEIMVPYLPRSTMFVFDGRLKRAYADCPGTGPLVEPRMYGRNGGPFEWPVFECATPLCCEVLADATSLARDSWMEIYMATREDAI